MRDVPCISLLLLAFVSAGCASSPDSAPRIGNKLVVTADGLERVEHEQRGTLFLKRNHGISTGHQYVLSQVLVTYQPDSPRFTPTEEARMRAYVEEGLAASLQANGSNMVSEAGPCVLSIGIGMVDVVLHKPNTTGSSTNQLEQWGAVTMVLDIRDSESGAPLLRYGRRVGIPGGVQFRDAHPQWTKVQQTLDELLKSQRLTLREIVPPSPEIDASCGGSPVIDRAVQQTQSAATF
jgi:hypothetical protein